MKEKILVIEDDVQKGFVISKKRRQTWCFLTWDFRI